MGIYEIREEARFHQDIGRYVTYGVQARDGEKVCDLSTKREQVAAFIWQLNTYEVSERHLHELAEDYVCTLC